jgi:hypothetical protein
MLQVHVYEPSPSSQVASSWHSCVSAEHSSMLKLHVLSVQPSSHVQRNEPTPVSVHWPCPQVSPLQSLMSVQIVPSPV